MGHLVLGQQSGMDVGDADIVSQSLRRSGVVAGEQDRRVSGELGQRVARGAGVRAKLVGEGERGDGATVEQHHGSGSPGPFARGDHLDHL